jgi:hypothetical protein
MRIIGYIEHPSLKITIFKMDTKITVKFENAQFEQAYKFRMTNELSGTKDVQKLVDEKFIEGVLQQFKLMNGTTVQAMERFVEVDLDDEFDVII